MKVKSLFFLILFLCSLTIGNSYVSASEILPTVTTKKADTATTGKTDTTKSTSDKSTTKKTETTTTDKTDATKKTTDKSTAADGDDDKTTAEDDESTGLSTGDLSSNGDASGALIGAKTKESLKKAEEDASLMDGFIIGQANNLFNIPGINSIQNLVFGNPYKTWGFQEKDTNALIDGIFYQSELDSFIHPLIGLFSGVYATILMLAIMLGSLRFGMKAYSPQAKADFWKDINMYFASAMFMGCFWMFFHMLTAINWGIIQSISETLKGLGKSLDGVSIIASATKDGSYTFAMGDIFVFLAEWGLSAYLNFIYIARKIIIVLLCVMSPIAAYSLLFTKTRSFFGTYIKELCGNIFLPSIHSIILFVFVQMAGNLGQGMGPTIFKLGMIIMFVPITGMVSKWLNLGDSSSAMGRTATSLGMAGIGGAMMLSRGSYNMAAGKGAGGHGGQGSGAGGTETPSGSQVSMSNDAGSSSLSRAASGGQSWSRVKQTMAKAGAVAGGTVGLPFGPGGVMAGSMIGSKVVSSLAQGTRNVTSGAKGVSNVIRNAGRGVDESGQPSGKFSLANLKGNWSDLAERRQMMGNLGEALGQTGAGIGGLAGMALGGAPGAAIGSLLGGQLGTSGKAMGQMLSGVSRQRAFDFGSGGESPRGMTLSDLAEDSRFRGSNVRFNQTNDRSWFEMQNGDQWQRIGSFGAGDANLKTNQRRAVDYKLRDNNEQWKRQENGSYMRESLMPNMPNSNAGQSNTMTPRVERQVAGLSGSTGNLGRQSEAYMMDQNGLKVNSDTGFDMRRLNPDEYFNHNAPGKTGVDDKVANLVGVKAPNLARNVARKTQETSKRMGWAQSGVYNDQERKKDII
ncbi:hypothetical protein PTI45_04638 [Paenibacillus nuruki]|uniref:Uncharacterized protein n=1 Tax=Paenibacillus nuruki TaxID=1886670 RepID=A0A1E3KWW2_9BACL|nr:MULTISPECIES: hypothetical protein [Paenibacillus]ODP26029.1 hypothetical protein PTI45_04638 [Paenibacillus nuruki]TKJ87249.1 hypothetical protein PaeCFBP13512_18680 [Paenibacillus sp. CFBP13512]